MKRSDMEYQDKEVNLKRKRVGRSGQAGKFTKFGDIWSSTEKHYFKDREMNHSEKVILPV